MNTTTRTTLTCATAALTVMCAISCARAQEQTVAAPPSSPAQTDVAKDFYDKNRFIFYTK